MSESTGHSYLESHRITSAALLFDLAVESNEVLAAARAAPVGHAGKTLVREGPLRMVIIGLTAGARIHDHQAGGPLSLHVLSGLVDVAGAGPTETLNEGRVLAFASNVTHSLEAKADSVVLVTIGWAQS